MNTQTIMLSFAIFILLLSTGSGVVRPDVHRQQKSPPAEPPQKPFNMTHGFDTSQSSYVLSHVTAQYCCKLGESLVRKLNTCRPTPTVRTNIMRKGKWSFRRETSAILSTELRRCRNQQHVVLKCCTLRFQYVKALNSCKIQSSSMERRKCRRNVRDQYGFRIHRAK